MVNGRLSPVRPGVSLSKRKKAPRKGRFSVGGAIRPESDDPDLYYVPDEMWPASDENEPVIAEASVGMTVTRARPMAAAIRPYSMAVAPDSFWKNFFI